MNKIREYLSTVNCFKKENQYQGYSFQWLNLRKIKSICSSPSILKTVAPLYPLKKKVSYPKGNLVPSPSSFWNHLCIYFASSSNLLLKWNRGCCGEIHFRTTRKNVLLDKKPKIFQFLFTFFRNNWWKLGVVKWEKEF